MKLFLDTAHLADIEKGRATGLINGVTTNPTYLSKEGGDLKQLLVAICRVMAPYDVSIEVTEKEPDTVYQQAKKIADIGPNVVIKIPCAKEYIPVIRKLVSEGVALNITLLFSLVQGLLMAKLGVKYISPFVGRLDDIDSDGIQLIADLRHMIDTYEYKTQILAASLRTVTHVHQVILEGADVATMPINLFELLIEHPLTFKGMIKFDEDWRKLGIAQFP
jgi:transaldolase